MTPRTTGRPRSGRVPGHMSNRVPEFVTASLLTSATGAEVHLVSADGSLLRLSADEDTARRAVIGLWKTLDRERR